MRILLINVVCGIRSTGRICTDIADGLIERGHDVKIAYGRGEVPAKYKKNSIKIGNGLDVCLHSFTSMISDRSGFGSKNSTIQFIEWIKKFDPDIIHLHNLHGYYINIGILFEYLRYSRIKVIWTLHDCWAFTGHAAFCEAAHCNRWKTGCDNCPKSRDYPQSLVDRSRGNWEVKRKLFGSLKEIQIVTPSYWLENLVKESFLNKYPVYTIYNGIDLSAFSYKDSNIKKQLGIENKRVILGVAAIWNRRKGLKDFIEVSKRIDENYCIILIGLTKKQKEKMPDNIIGIERTDSVYILAEYYSIAEFFFNPTYEDNFPTTNIEALACGTPVITYNTGGSPEAIIDECGAVIQKGDVDTFVAISRNNSFNREKCIERGQFFNRLNMIENYLKVYMRIGMDEVFC